MYQPHVFSACLSILLKENSIYTRPTVIHTVTMNLSSFPYTQKVTYWHFLPRPMYKYLRKSEADKYIKI